MAVARVFSRTPSGCKRKAIRFGGDTLSSRSAKLLGADFARPTNEKRVLMFNRSSI
ncbi:MAG: hypothetical protein IJF39_01535 [Clostridia bacterium]|nr:hypothetical protein [Clostridia bacterium]